MVKVSNYTFPILVFLWEVAVLLIYGLLIGFDQKQNTNADLFRSSQILVVVGLILLIVGLGLVASYISSSSVSGIAFTLLIFALTFQHFFIFRAFWYKAGAFDPDQNKTFSEASPFNVITLSNFGMDRKFDKGTFRIASAFDAIACSIALFIGFIPTVGKIGITQIFFLTLFGTFFWDVNNALLYRFFITDVGYGMRIFIFGSFLGLISSIILGKREQTKNHPRYSSDYPVQALSLLGIMIVWCCFPILTEANLFTSDNNRKIVSTAPLNMWLALAAGVMGSFAASALAYRKTHIHDLIFSAITGGIAFSSSGDVNFNPAVPLTVGYILGFACSFLNQSLGRRVNKSGVLFSLSLIQHFIIPGLISGFLSAILQAIGQNSYNETVNNMDDGRTFVQQGAWQLMGIVFSIGVGILGGAIIGFLYRLFDRHTQKEDQFNDQKHFDLDDKPAAVN